MDVLRILGKAYNFRMKVTKHTQWGVPIKSGIWTGVIGAVHNGTADIGIAHVTLTYGRYAIIDHCTVFINEPHYISAKPRQLSSIWNLIKPFDKYVWATLPCMCGIIAILLKRLNGKCSLLEAFLCIYGMIMGQMKIFFISGLHQHFWVNCLFFAFFISSAYECNFRAYLMSVDLEPYVDSDMDVYTQGRHLILPHGTGWRNRYRNSPFLAQQEIYLKSSTKSYRSGPPVLESANELIENDYAMFTTKYVAMALLKRIVNKYGHNPFHLSKSRINLPLMNAGFTIRKQYPWKPHFNKILMRLQAGGIIDYKIRSYTLQWHEDGVERGLEALNLMHVSTGMLACLIGLFLSAIALAFEMGTGRNKLHENRRKTAWN